VRIIVDIHLGTDGRSTGTVRAIDQTEEHSFSGNLEFFGLIERLYQSEPDRIENCQPQEES
jgi:hypothetical protein